MPFSYRSKSALNTNPKRHIGISLKRNLNISNYIFPVKDLVPAGIYSSVIVDIKKSETFSHKDAVDVFYKLFNDQTSYYVLQRYRLDSNHFYDLCDRIISAGIPDNSDLSAAIGLKETVQLVYPPNGYGSICACVSNQLNGADDILTPQDTQDDWDLNWDDEL
jgi:hypothetical protein